LIPSTILLIRYDAIEIGSQTCHIDGDCCPEFDPWLDLNGSNHRIDFRRIERVGSGLRCFSDYVVNVAEFEERSMIDESDGIGKEIYHRLEDESIIYEKSIRLSENVRTSRIEHLINLRHRCIAGPIGFGIESSSPQELKLARLYFEGCSLAEVLSVHPIWWTSTVKAKTIAGIVLGLQFVHSLGLRHGHLTGSNIILDADHCIQIVDFHSILSDVDESQSEEDLQLTLTTDVCAFISILFEIVVGRPAHGEILIPTNIRCFVSNIIEFGLRPDRKCSFHDILEFLKANNFQIEDGVDSAEVFAFVNWVESAE
jgi:hypothetical protein